MITEEDYLKAKKIVQEYESKHLNISDVKDSSDFKKKLKQIHYYMLIQLNAKTLNKIDDKSFTKEMSHVYEVMNDLIKNYL